jgi:hypothetical protein
MINCLKNICLKFSKTILSSVHKSINNRNLEILRSDTSETVALEIRLSYHLSGENNTLNFISPIPHNRIARGFPQSMFQIQKLYSKLEN